MKKPAIAIAAVVVLAWLGLWVSDKGVHVSSTDTGILKTRECHYFIGVSVLKRFAPIADRCPVLRTVGP
mgnify:CR=1 FL=1